MRKTQKMTDADTIIESLEKYPEEWLSARYTLTHVPSRLMLWTANGVFGLKTDSDSAFKVEFPNQRTKRRLWKAYLIWLTTRNDNGY